LLLLLLLVGVVVGVVGGVVAAAAAALLLLLNIMTAVSSDRGATYRLVICNKHSQEYAAVIFQITILKM
jgi:hypothetical protein